MGYSLCLRTGQSFCVRTFLTFLLTFISGWLCGPRAGTGSASVVACVVVVYSFQVVLFEDHCLRHGAVLY